MEKYLLPTGALPVPKAAPGVVYPAWMDGRYITAAARYSLSEPIVIAPDATVTIPANPLRWGIGILAPGALLDTMSISVDVQPALFPLRVSASQGTRWLTIFEFGPIVTAQLYVHDSAGITFKYVEVSV